MAWNAADNVIFFQRLANFAAAFQNLREEGARLSALLALEASPGGVDDAAFVDLDSTQTKTAAKNMIGYAGDFKFFNEAGSVGTFNRQDFLTPFLVNKPAG